MLDRWLNLRMRVEWASQAYRQGVSAIDVEPLVILIGAVLLTLGMMRF